MNGEAFKKDFKFIPIGLVTEPTIEYLDDTFIRCCFDLPVLASSSSSDTFKNDITSAYYGFSSLAESVNIKLLLEGEEVADLNDNTYGTFYEFGFHENEGKKYIGYSINWKSILLAFGTGKYQIRFDVTTIFSTVEQVYWFDYCLKEYTLGNSDETVRIDFTHNGIIGNWKDDKDIRSFKGLNWENSIRLPKAMIYNERSEFESEQIQYNSGFIEDVKLEQTPIYDLIIEPLPNEIHRYLRCEVMTADEITISDYNYKSPLRPFLGKEVKFRGNYEPNWQLLNNKSSVLLQFEQRFNNLRKRFC